jgi:hypothetical protein
VNAQTAMKVSGRIYNFIDGNKFKYIVVWLSKRIYKWTRRYVCGWTNILKKPRLLCE